MTNEPFSTRHGFRQTNEAEISVRHDAPYELRGVLVDLAYDCGYQPKPLRTLVCRILRKRPDPDNWSDRNVDKEVRQLLDGCDWYRIYDVAEALITRTSEAPIPFDGEKFQPELNAYFIENGIGGIREDTISMR